MDKVRALQYLAAAAAEKSFAGAARVQGVTVPAIARMIKALEDHLGILLFERSHRGLALTPGGSSYLEACTPLLAELAWLSPKRLEVLIQTAHDPVLRHLKDQFDASFEPAGDSADAMQDLAWFPAWVLTRQAQFVGELVPAQPGQHSAPEQATRLLVNLLSLERQGRHHDIVAQRKHLRELNGWLYACYMQTR